MKVEITSMDVVLKGRYIQSCQSRDYLTIYPKVTVEVASVLHHSDQQF